MAPQELEPTEAISVIVSSSVLQKMEMRSYWRESSGGLRG